MKRVISDTLDHIERAEQSARILHSRVDPVIESLTQMKADSDDENQRATLDDAISILHEYVSGIDDTVAFLQSTRQPDYS